ncbi:MAG: gephyrin-like molybdotransferase Glp [Thermoanaerobaculia bacterium]
MIAFAEALARVLEATTPMPACTVPIEDAVSRVLAENVRADQPLPGFETTAMDGWAVRASDVPRSPSLLAIAGVSGAGAVPGILPPGAAWKVMTGAPMPPGSDAVVPVEDAAAVDGDTVRLDVLPRCGAHVRRRGEIFETGTLLLAAGRRLSPSDLVLAAAAGRETLRVSRAPRAGVLVTGDELVAPGTHPGPGQLRNTNGPLLLAALRRAGAEAVALGVAPDDEAALARAFREALAADFDILLTTGGVSAGDYDYVGRALATEGARVRFHKVSIRPAKPVLLATKGSTLVFGLPGNPVSAAVAFDFLVRPALRAAAGLQPPLPEPVPARLTAPVRNKGPRLAFHPARLAWDRGRLAAEPLPTRGSHDILTHARADAFLELAPESSWDAGDAVPLHRGTAESTF